MARWLIARYQPTALFSLKSSRATSTVGKTLVVPTPYAFKMALVDAGLQRGGVTDPNGLIKRLAKADVRIGVPEVAVVTHSIIKVRQEPKKPTPENPYISAIAYREFVQWSGELRFALDAQAAGAETVAEFERLAPLVNYIGKRGGFIQYCGMERTDSTGSGFTQRWDAPELEIPDRAHVTALDDFGPEANWDSLNSFSEKPIKRGKHRAFRDTLIPLGVVNQGAGFAVYVRAGSGGE